MKIAIYKPAEVCLKYLQKYFDKTLIELVVINKELTIENIKYAAGCRAISTFVNNICDKNILQGLKNLGINCILNRCAGYDNVDLKTAAKLKIKVYRVPAYAPESIAEFAIAMLLCLIRGIHSAYNRFIHSDFSLQHIEPYILRGKTVGVIGTGLIGTRFIDILKGFGCRVIAFDKFPNYDKSQKYNFKYVDLPQIWQEADVISLHCPGTPETKHIICEETILKMKEGVVIVNTSRGTLIDTKDLLKFLKLKKIKGACLDVYEGEQGKFFYNMTGEFIDDPVLFELQHTPTVLLTSHEAFFTTDSLEEISKTTVHNIENFIYNQEHPEQEVRIKEEIYFDLDNNKIING